MFNLLLIIFGLLLLLVILGLISTFLSWLKRCFTKFEIEPKKAVYVAPEKEETPTPNCAEELEKFTEAQNFLNTLEAERYMAKSLGMSYGDFLQDYRRNPTRR